MLVQRPLPTALRPTLTAREAAALLHVSTRTIYRWVAQGRLQAVEIGGTKRILTTTFIRLLCGHHPEARP
jgi:excisionase family DNA binding protein